MHATLRDEPSADICVFLIRLSWVFPDVYG